MADQSNAGPFKVGLEGSLGPDQTKVIELSEVATGPANKEGYLRKIFGSLGGVDYLYIVNASSELISVETKSGATIVPSATSQNLDSGPYRALRVTNEGANTINTDASDQIAIEVGNGPRSGDEGKSFSVRKAVNDTVPGVNL